MEFAELPQHVADIVRLAKRARKDNDPLTKWIRSTPTVSEDLLETLLSFRTELVGLQRDAELMEILLREASTTSSFTEVLRYHPLAAHILLDCTSNMLKILEGLPPVSEISNPSEFVHNRTAAEFEALQALVSRDRAALRASFKRIWYLHLTRYDQQPSVQVHLPQLEILLKAFSARPFGVGVYKDQFIEYFPRDWKSILRETDYREPMRLAGQNWVPAGQSTAPNLLAATHSRLLELFWSGGVEGLAQLHLNQLLDGQQENFRESQRRLDSHVRDAINRSRSTVFRVVFVGGEDAGKSTLLNALVGLPLLPTGGGPTTVYPCRIRHVPGQIDPRLTIDTSVLHKIVEEVQKGGWGDIVDGIGEFEWNGERLPPGFDRSQFINEWFTLPLEAEETMTLISRDGFQIAAVTLGTDAICETLTIINHIVRIGRVLRMGFEYLELSLWANIEVEFPNFGRFEGLGDTSTGGRIHEFIDIPGIRFAQSEFRWDELTRDVVRNAHLVVAVVSLMAFDASSWRLLPRVIAEGTSARVGAVVLTFRDASGIDTSVVNRCKKRVTQFFWPESIQGQFDADAHVFTCSSTIGISSLYLERLLEGLEKPPSWETLFNSPASAAILSVYPEAARALFRRASVKQLLADAESALEQSGIKLVIQGLSKLLYGNGWKEVINSGNHGLIDIIEGLETIMSKSLEVSTSMSMGKELPSSGGIRSIPTNDDTIEAFITSSNLLREDIKALLVDASSSMQRDIDHRIKESLSLVSKKQGANAPVIFETLDEVKAYLHSCQVAIELFVTSLEEATMERVMLDTEKARSSRLSDLYERVAAGNPDVENRLSRPFERIAPNPEPFDLGSPKSYVQEERRYAIGPAFSYAQKTIYTKLAPRGIFGHEIGELRTISKTLLAIATTIPFILGLPYWLWTSHLQYYRLLLNSLQGKAMGLASERSQAFIRRLAEGVEQQLEQELQLAKSLYHNENEGRVFVSTELKVEMELTQHIIAAHANLLAVSGGLEAVAVSLGSK